MSLQPPKIDQRSYNDIVEQTEKLAKQYTNWRPKSEGKPDAGGALICIFGRMATLVSDRLNQVPEKNFLAFLDLIGTQLLPPQSAKVPLTFQLAEGSPVDAVVPAHTQVAAPPAEGEEDEIVFETDRELVVTTAQLQAVFVREPGEDKYSDRTLAATGTEDAAFKAFVGEQAIEHCLYLACDELFTLPGNKTVTLTINSPQASELKNLPISWSYWDGLAWKQLTLESSSLPTNNQWQVQFDLPVLTKYTIDGFEAGWLRTRLENPLPPTHSSPLPIVNSISTTVKIELSGLKPDLCFFNTVPLDLSKDFYPFGEQPRFNDTFYIANQEAFSRPGTTVTIKLKLTEGMPVKTDGGVEIGWEIWNGNNWTELAKKNSISPENFTQDGEVTLTLPSDINQGTVNGETSYWIRARIVKGDYGKPAISRQRGDSNGHPIYEFIPASFQPPSVESLSLSYTYEASRPLSACRAYNDFHYVDVSTTQSFQPFKPTTDQNPALYLGFDKAFANRPMTLYAHVEPPQPNEVANPGKTSETEPVRLVWEYASSAGWKSLGARDETNAFAERGLIQFIGPTDCFKTKEFGQELYWLRVRWDKGQFRVPPRLRRLLTNTIWATQAITLENEILGSSDGNPNQTFRTSQKPILPGQQLDVQEPQGLFLEEQGAIEALVGDEAVNLVRDEAGQIEEIWVRWQEVPDFYGSGPRDRHYMLDRLTGEVRFGDGQYGRVPPQGRQTIRLSYYRTGGGIRGNVAANRIVQLKTTVPYVDGVTNLEAAGGGAPQESLEQVKERGPKVLRHRDRAVTVQDFEDLAYEASPDVARAKAIPPVFDPLKDDHWLAEQSEEKLKEHTKPEIKAGQVRLLIVPRSSARQPVPSLALLDRVEAYIRARCAATVDLQVIGPQWQGVSVQATVVPVSLDGADAVRASVVRRLAEFLHPLTGGKEGQGWSLGRLPHKSDLYGVIEAVQGVDYVQSLAVEPNPNLEKNQLSPEQLIYSGAHTIYLQEGV
ncbi:putative baseplate assembly protein [Coleofasciculus sp.]|uniref:putative baseplate assembly protein n=1 Tax=Coleofasciculus sp. TaxID=3100458 RepID=UPI003A1C27B4